MLVRALLIFSAISLIAPSAYAADNEFAVEISAGTLRDALIEFGRQTKTSVFFAEEMVQSKDTQGISGFYTSREALSKLLDGTCLAYDFIRDRFATLSVEDCSLESQAVPPAPVAPSEPPPDPIRGIEEILVTDTYITGSRLRQAGFGKTMPVDVIDATEIRLMGFQSLGEILRYVPAVSGNSTSTLISNGGDGTATVTLRGLPASNTLVLLNGRRLNTNALDGAAVDLNSLPLALVEQIEILKDGVSAIYGSDAVAGVVNVITKTDLSGLTVDYYRGESRYGDLDTEHLSISGGWGNDRTSVSVGLSHYDQDGVLSRNRDLSASSNDLSRGGIDKRSSSIAPARISVPGGPVTLIDGLLGNQITDFRPITSDDRFEYRDHTSSIVPFDRTSLFAQFSMQASPQWQANADLLISSTDALTLFAPVPLFTGFESIPLPVAANQIYNPFGVELTDVRRRIVELPARETRNQTDTVRVGFGMIRESERWRLSIQAQHQETRAEEERAYSFNALRVAQALSGDCFAPCVPLNLFGPAGSITSDMLNFLLERSTVKGVSELTGLSVQSDWAFRSLEISSGVEIRRESLSVSPDEVLQRGLYIAGGNRGRANGDRDVVEAYAEVFIPILSNQPGFDELSAQLATRVSHYDDFGYVVNPRLVLNWRPIQRWHWRASVGRGFRAPSLIQLHSGEQQSFQQLNDPCSVDANLTTFLGCDQVSDPSLTQFLTITGGEKELDPERALSLSVGTFIEVPWRDHSFNASVDWYFIEQEDVVESSAQFIVNQNARLGRFDNRISRDPLGNLNRVLATLQNIGQREVTGFDVSANVTLRLNEIGYLILATSATHIQSFRDKFDPDSPTVDKAGTFSDEASGGLGALPDWKVNLSASLEAANWQLAYNVYHVSSLREYVPLRNRKRTISSWSTHNVTASYFGPWTWWVRTTFGINNLLDEEPPFSAAAFNDSYDGRTYDITGRYFYLRFDKSF